LSTVALDSDATMSPLRGRIAQLVRAPGFSRTVIGLILLNAVLIGLETYPSIQGPWHRWFVAADQLLLWAFTVEIALKVIAARPLRRFFLDGWNLFDVIIVGSGHLLAGAHFVSVLRILRVLRVLRTVSVVPSLQRMVTALLRSIPSMGNIILLLGLHFYIFGVLGTSFFGQASPEYFGTLHHTFLTLFQVVTLESWASGVMRPVMLASPYAWAYFVAFILLGTFVVFNLFVGVIVNSMQQADSEANAANAPDPAAEMAHLRAEIGELKTLLLGLRAFERSLDPAHHAEAGGEHRPPLTDVSVPRDMMA
jgi:voltage-gated sodium channel